MTTVAYRPVSNISSRRFDSLVESFEPLRQYLNGQRVLDFGASDGLSMVAARRFGASFVAGVEPDARRIAFAQENVGDWGEVLHVEDTTALPYEDGSFGAVLCNAVLEHIPQPRDGYIREMWRVLRPGGHLIISETPNKYLPVDFHTTGLPLINWLPEKLAHRIAVRLGRFSPTKTNWSSSGWRGLGHFELFSCLDNYRDVSPKERFRHKLVGQLFDPYPRWVIQKRPA